MKIETSSTGQFKVKNQHTTNCNEKGIFGIIGDFLSYLTNLFFIFTIVAFIIFVCLMFKSGNDILGVSNLYWIFTLGLFFISFLRIILGKVSNKFQVPPERIRFYWHFFVLYMLVPIFLVAIGFSDDLNQIIENKELASRMTVVVKEIGGIFVIWGIGIISPICASLSVFLKYGN